MEDTELVAFDDLTSGGAEDRETAEAFAAATGLPELTALGLGTRGAFLTASDTDARGRAVALMLPLVDPIEPVGETTDLRTAATASEDGFVLVDKDRGPFGAGAEDFVGAIEALRVGAAGVAAGFEADDIARRDVAAGADVAGFFNGGAAAFGTTAAAAVAVALGPVGLTEPAPNVPELIT
jgi:hypothetical protein